MTLHQGDLAPDFTLDDQNHQPHTLSSYRGQWVLIYFYPKDDTPGCTTEACGLRDNFPEFQNVSAVILGISKDSVASHQKFTEKYDLPFTLLSDPDHKVLKTYDAWGEKSFMGKLTIGIRRCSYLIDPNGKIAKIYPKVKPPEHAEEVLKDLQELTNSHGKTS